MAGETEIVPEQHPISLYLKIWLLLFLLSTFSYMVDYFALQGVLRWGLIIFFMVVKAALILTIFMHVKWERLGLKIMLLLPPLALLVFAALMAIEGDYTLLNRLMWFSA
jgi:cytochrome c oxidase subunit IV